MCIRDSSGVGYSADARRQVEGLTEYAREASGRSSTKLIDDPGARIGLADLAVEAAASRLLSYRVVWMQSQNLIPNYEASMSKAFGSELSQRVANFGTRLIGLPSQRIDPEDPHAPLHAGIGRAYMGTVPSTIAQGSSEIQRNIIATRGSGLPRQ